MDYIKNAVKLRRELHQIPELGWGEFCTTAKILETIEPLGWKTFVGVEQIGLDAVMGRSEDFVEKSKKNARIYGHHCGIRHRQTGPRHSFAF